MFLGTINIKKGKTKIKDKLNIYNTIIKPVKMYEAETIVIDKGG